MAIEEARVVAIEGDGPGVDVRLADGRVLSFAGLFCGDAAGPSGSIATAVGDGARAGVAVHQSLVFR